MVEAAEVDIAEDIMDTVVDMTKHQQSTLSVFLQVVDIHQADVSVLFIHWIGLGKIIHVYFYSSSDDGWSSGGNGWLSGGNGWSSGGDGWSNNGW